MRISCLKRRNDPLSTQRLWGPFSHSVTRSARMAEDKSAQSARCEVLPEGMTRRRSGSGQRRRKVLVDRSQELFGGQPPLVRADQQSEVLSHLALLDGLDADALEAVSYTHLRAHE